VTGTALQDQAEPGVGARQPAVKRDGGPVGSLGGSIHQSSYGGRLRPITR